MAAVGETAGGALGFLVRLGSTQDKPEAAVVLADVLDVEGDELAAAQCAGEAEQQQGPVPGVGQAIAERGDHRRDDLRAGRAHLPGRHALASADAGPDRPHPGVGRRRLEARHLVSHADRGQPPADRRGLARLGQGGEVERHGRRRRRQRLDRRLSGRRTRSRKSAKSLS